MIGRDFIIPDGVRAIHQPHRMLFRYYKDRYAAMLLEDILQPRLAIRDVRAGRYGRLLDRPLIKTLVAAKGDGFLHRDDLVNLWPYETQTYVVTFAVWGSENRLDQRWHQISRPRRQLVLQLNFPHAHNAEYYRLIPDAKEMPFAADYHPVNIGPRLTMAWSRIDIDFASGEALIEEVQSDWIRNAREKLGYALEDRAGRYWEPAYRDRLKTYVETALAPHTAMWSEAVLAATLHVLIHLCGITRVWYHDFETGCEVKRMTGWRPPRSLYTDLPKGFCFERTEEAPEFIGLAQPRWLRQKLERGEGRFWRREVGYVASSVSSR